jgi:hypothetical protein
MANDVYANGREISCKAADGKSVCAFPDVCLSPPSPPAGPIPIPYPNTALAQDTTSGSKSVKISGKEVMLKNKSYFKKSTGDEAATKSLGMGVVTHQITGKVYFASWSMDVKIEGQNAVRHLDLTTHNHMSVPGNSPTWPYLDTMSMAEKLAACGEEMDAVAKKCPNSGKMGKTHEDCPPYTKSKTHNRGYGEDPCIKAKRCMLVPYDRTKTQGGCCPGQTPHHLVPKHHFSSHPKYDQDNAPCVCVEGYSWHRSDESYFPNAKKTHPMMHDLQDATERSLIDQVENDIANGVDTGGRSPSNAMHYDEARETAIAAHQNVFHDPECSEKCLRAQLDAYHNQCGVGDDDLVETTKTGSQESPEDIEQFWGEQNEHFANFFGQG